MMDIKQFLQEIRNIDWFKNSGEPDPKYHMIFSVFEAYDTWNEQTLNTWEPNITELENKAISRIGDEAIDEIFTIISLEIGDIIWKKWCRFIEKCHLENESGLDDEMPDMVKRDISWSFIEKLLNCQGFFCQLLTIYEEGYFPCSWDGDYPEGKAVVL